MKKPVIGKEYFKHMDLEAIVRSYPCRKNLHQEDIIKG
jgi:dual specificity protein kinase YAK1